MDDANRYCCGREEGCRFLQKEGRRDRLAACQGYLTRRVGQPENEMQMELVKIERNYVAEF